MTIEDCQIKKDGYKIFIGIRYYQSLIDFAKMFYPFVGIENIKLISWIKSCESIFGILFFLNNQDDEKGSHTFKYYINVLKHHYLTYEGNTELKEIISDEFNYHGDMKEFDLISIEVIHTDFPSNIDDEEKLKMLLNSESSKRHVYPFFQKSDYAYRPLSKQTE